MKAATVNELKQELIALPPKEVLELCLRLARYKKENKELLTYLLFEAHDLQSYIENVKREIDEEFAELPRTTPFHTKKSLRKILRALTKYSKHTASKQAEVEMLLYFTQKLKNSAIRLSQSAALTNLYNHQIKKINVAVELLHEDLHYDYKKQLEELA